MIAAWVGLAVLTSTAWAGPPEFSVKFLSDHCLDCHAGEDAEAGFDLRSLGVDLTKPDIVRKWVNVHDRVRAGEMPPKDAGDVDKADAETFGQQLSEWLTTEQKKHFEESGRVRGRRLTNLQLERTLNDLFAIDIPLTGMLPEEQRTDGFVGIAAAQSISHFHLQNHLEVVDAALDAAFARAAETDDSYRKKFSAKELSRRRKSNRNRSPELIDGKAVVWASGPIFYGRMPNTGAPKGGWYRIRLTASAIRPPGGHGVWCTVRSGVCFSGAPQLAWIGSFEATKEPRDLTFTAWIPEEHILEIHPGDATLKRGKFDGGQVDSGYGERQKLSGVAIHSMELEEFFPGGSVKQVRENLFGKEAWYFVSKKTGLSVKYSKPLQQASQQLEDFAARAFRRPAEKEQLQPYRRLLSKAIADGAKPADALRAAYRAILCSPRFMYLKESPGALDDFAIAARLSYFLWNSIPDEELLRLAREGKLKDRETIQAQVDRMLKGSGGKRFVNDFADQWLDLVDINFTEPDRKRFRDFDPIVQNAMLDETRTYVHDLIMNNRPISRLIKSEYSYLNERLARYYGIKSADLKDGKIRRVSLDKNSHRGGLLAQGAILKVTANGTDTSPILRGVWIADRILGEHIPPPPENVPAIEPDVRGATTIREQLVKHREDESCASCHRQMDPNGFALENFDAGGRWRERYFKTKGKSARVDPSYHLADGTKFTSFEEFRDLIAAMPAALSRAYVEKLLVYGTGAPIQFTDRVEVDGIVERAKADKYRMKSQLKSVVTSRTFLSK